MQGIHAVVGMQRAVEIADAGIGQRVRQGGGISVDIRRHGAAHGQAVFPGPGGSPCVVLPEDGIVDEVREVEVGRAETDAPFPGIADQVRLVLL